KKAGVSEVAINQHHHAQKIPEALGDGSAFGMKINYSMEEEILGTGGGIVRLRAFLEQGTFFLINGDILSSVDLQALLAFHRQRRAVATMLVRPIPKDADYTPLGIDQEGWLVQFKNSQRKAKGQIRPVMFCGVHVLEPQVFDFLPADGFACINNQAYTAMIDQGLDVAAFLDQGPWFDLGTPASYLAANRAILSGRVGLPQIKALDLADREKKVMLGSGVQLGQSVTLGPEVILGDGCVVGDGARIARSVLWPGVKVAPGTNLNSVIMTETDLVEV
ncbi:MAG: NDP-sugar synthase, partial [Deltaproteobacteria bacterium]|nr:NDP-sugar synthase [Deltaproteobacteria bacterium]